VFDAREWLCEIGCEDAVVFDNPEFDAAIIGVSEDGRAIYDYNKMVAHLMETDGMSELEAVEFIDYNTLRAIPYAGEHAPIVMCPIEEAE
jgi:hypothetical protein